MAAGERWTPPLGAALLLDPLVGGLGQDLEAALLVELRTLILLAAVMVLLLLKLVIALETERRQGAGGDGRGNRAVRLAGVPAVAETAAFSQCVDFGEGARERVGGVPQLQFAHAGRVDQDAPVGQDQELTGGAGVTAAAIAGADVAREQPLFADQRVRDRRLADTGRSEEGRGPAPRHALAERNHGLGLLRGHGEDWNARRDSPGVADERRHVLDEVSLVQHDDGRRTAVPRGEQVALDAPRVEIAIEAGDEEHDVDVRGDDLLLGRVTRGAPGKPAGPRKNRADPRVAVRDHGVERDPVADGGKVGARRGFVAQPAGDARERLAPVREHPVDVRMLVADAGGNQAGGAMRRERLIAPGRPPQVFEGHGRGAAPPRAGVSLNPASSPSSAALPRRSTPARRSRAAGTAPPRRRSR